MTILLLDTLPVAAVLLCADGRVLRANYAARVLLEAGDGLVSSPGGYLCASLSEEQERLCRLLATIATEIQAHRPASFIPPLRLDRPSGQLPLLLLFDQIPNASLAEASPKARLLLRILDSEQGSKGRIYPLRSLFNLTTAEARVAELIATGHSSNTVADRLGLSRNTVRTHLAHIFDKTGVRSQHALVRVLIALGSWPTE